MSIDTKFIGKTYPTHTYEVGKEKIKEYAKAIKNPDPHYLDDDFAKKSKYGNDYRASHFRGCIWRASDRTGVHGQRAESEHGDACARRAGTGIL